MGHIPRHDGETGWLARLEYRRANSERLAVLEREVQPLPRAIERLPERQNKLESTWDRVKARAAYGLANVLLSMLLAGKMTPEQAGKIAHLLLKLWPVWAITARFRNKATRPYAVLATVAAVCVLKLAGGLAWQFSKPWQYPPNAATQSAPGEGTGGAASGLKGEGGRYSLHGWFGSQKPCNI